jgi:hypothetical protein
MMITKNPHVQDRVSLVAYARTNALDGLLPWTGRRSVSPIETPSTGGVRPQAGSCFEVTTRAVDMAKGGVRLRSLGPPI